MTAHRTSPFRYLAAAAAGAALMLGGVAVGGVALAEESSPPASTPPTSAVAVDGIDLAAEELGDVDTDIPAECGVFFDGPLPGELGPDDELPQELIDELNAETDALAAHLDAAGVTYTVVDEDGLRYLDWDFDDEAASDAVDSFYDGLYGDLDLDADEMSQELIDELNAETDALAAHLDAAGVVYTIVDEGGLRYLDWDYDNEAATEAVEAFYSARYGDEAATEDFEHDFEIPEGCEQFFVDDCGDDDAIHQNEEDDVDLPAAA